MDNQPTTTEYKLNSRYAAHATISSRIIALVVDSLILAALIAGIIILAEFLSEGKLALMPTTFAIMGAYLYYPLMEGKYGATLGKMAMGIEVVGNNFQKIGYTKAFLRSSFRFLMICLLLLTPPYGAILLPTYLSIIAFLVNVVDFFASLNSLYSQMLHDVIADTYVIDAFENRKISTTDV